MENKMTPGQALEKISVNYIRLDNKHNYYTSNINKDFPKEVKVIKQALTELEKIRKANKELQGRCLRLEKEKSISLKQMGLFQMVNDNSDNEKQTELLKVLKNKKVDIWIVDLSNNVKEYNNSAIYEKLTKIEFDLIKEWLK